MFKQQSSKYYPKHVYKRKKFPDKRGGRGPLGGPLNLPLIQALDLLLIHLQNVNWMMHGSILPITMPPGHTPGDLQFFFFLGGLFPIPGHVERDNSPSPSSWSTSYTFFATSFWSVQRQNDTFSQLLWTFPWVFWDKDNGCHNVAKTWSINLKTKTKKNNFLKSASLIEHFMRTLDRISVSFYIYQKPCVRDGDSSLFKAKLKKYFCPSLPENKIHSSTHHTPIRFKF